MFKNKIYKYLSVEIFKNFITILLTFTAIAWTVRAVNFLDLMIEDGFSAIIYFKYSLLNIFTIITRFIPLSFLIAIIISIVKFERQKELFILWVTGLNKIKIVNIFLLIGFLISFFQLLLGVIINPYTLNKSRALLRESGATDIYSVLKPKAFIDNFQSITFYIDEKSSNNELINIFIRDSNNILGTIGESKSSIDKTIFAKKGMIVDNKLILLNGTIQNLNDRKINNFNFKKTELSISNFNTRIIKKNKIQETSSYKLLVCLLNNNSLICPYKNNKKIVVETLSRRIGMPLYIPLIAVISSFLLIYKKEKKNNFLSKYVVFSFAFIILIFTEILLKYTGFSNTNFILYFLFPVFLLIVIYSILLKQMISKKI
jgi:lipopolysaccharide export system permease protein